MHVLRGGLIVTIQLNQCHGLSNLSITMLNRGFVSDVTLCRIYHTCVVNMQHLASAIGKKNC